MAFMKYKVETIVHIVKGVMKGKIGAVIEVQPGFYRIKGDFGEMTCTENCLMDNDEYLKAAEDGHVAGLELLRVKLLEEGKIYQNKKGGLSTHPDHFEEVSRWRVGFDGSYKLLPKRHASLLEYDANGEILQTHEQREQGYKEMGEKIKAGSDWPGPMPEGKEEKRNGDGYAE